ncbi:bet1 golgi vesicular membrane traffiking protein 1 like, partial [Chelydra serpentina]
SLPGQQWGPDRNQVFRAGWERDCPGGGEGPGVSPPHSSRGPVAGEAESLRRPAPANRSRPRPKQDTEAPRADAAMADWGRGQSPSSVDDMLDMENKRMADNLATKVTRLKSLALDIDKDAEDQNRYLDGT